MTHRRRTGHPVGPWSRGLAVWVVAAVLGGAGTATAADNSPKLVVVVYPHESDAAPGIVLFNRAVRSTFASQATGRVEVRNEYVDATRLRDAEFMQAQVALLKRKFTGRKVDLVISVLSASLEFTLAIRNEVFPGVPVVFTLVDRREVEARDLPPDVVGVPVRMDMAGTLDLALRLQPETRRVFVIAGNSAIDRKREAEARREFVPYRDRVEFVFLTGLPMDDLLERVAGLPERSIIYYLHVFKDGVGKDFIPAEALERLAAAANAPVYTHVDTFVDRGALGGHVYVHESEGRVAAQLGARILSGERPESIPITGPDENAYLFNSHQLRRWGIAESSLPTGSEVRFKEPAFWDVYRWHVVGFVALCALQAILIAWLLIQRVRRHRSEAALRESEARFRLMADAAPVLIWTAGADKACTYLNRPWLEFTGRPLEQQLGEGWAEGVHVDDLQHCLDAYVTAFDRREPFEMSYRLRRHDGEYRWIVDRGVPRFSADNQFAGYIGACSDMTDRLRAEEGMRESRRELQYLSGQLIQAQEDERRRVARELHDDLNQGLALLSVEIDLLGHGLNGSSDGRKRVRELSARVKELSSVVHDLSHQLHPSKLEQLGLVAAVRGLCKELARHHALAVEFIHRDVPEMIPEATALCLYRIAQEALRNVIKHGRTDRARVELIGTAMGLRLQVRDDGAGFDPAARGKAGLGLVSMRERLFLVGGEITIESRPGSGTRIDVRVSLPRRDEVQSDGTAADPYDDDLMAVGLTLDR